MYIKITSKRQATFPKHVLETLGVEPATKSNFEKPKTVTFYVPRRIDLSLLGGLRRLIKPGQEPFDIRKFREGTYDPSLRD